jgi:hypothetical protein
MAPNFDIQYHRIYHCNMPACAQWPSAEVRLIDEDGNRSSHLQVCRNHVEWAKQEQTKRHAESRR